MLSFIYSNCWQSSIWLPSSALSLLSSVNHCHRNVSGIMWCFKHGTGDEYEDCERKAKEEKQKGRVFLCVPAAHQHPFNIMLEWMWLLTGKTKSWENTHSPGTATSNEDWRTTLKKDLLLHLQTHILTAYDFKRWLRKTYWYLPKEVTFPSLSNFVWGE